MWHTEHGDRVLKGAEAKVFAESLLDLIQCDLVEEGGFRAGIPVFDSLSSTQKIAGPSPGGQRALSDDHPHAGTDSRPGRSGGGRHPESSVAGGGRVRAPFNPGIFPSGSSSAGPAETLVSRRCQRLRVTILTNGHSAWSVCTMPSSGTSITWRMPT